MKSLRFEHQDRAGEFIGWTMTTLIVFWLILVVASGWEPNPMFGGIFAP